jgi:RNA polymerase sigma factor for flagellar operon FliA
MYSVTTMPATSEPAQRCKRSEDLAAYMPLVRKIAGRLGRRLPANVDMDELVQVGMIGLHEALSRFEQGPGSTFESYAARRIEGAMLDTLRAEDTLSRDSRARLREVRAAVQRLEHKLGRAPRAKEVANELDWPLEKFHRCMVDAGAGTMRTGDAVLEIAEDSPYSASEDETGPAGVVDDHADPLRALQARQRHAVLSAAFDALEEAERYVMESIYDRDLALRDIGQTLGVSEARVSQIRAEIVAKLKRRLHDT